MAALRSAAVAVVVVDVVEIESVIDSTAVLVLAAVLSPTLADVVSPTMAVVDDDDAVVVCCEFGAFVVGAIGVVHEKKKKIRKKYPKKKKKHLYSPASTSKTIGNSTIH